MNEQSFTVSHSPTLLTIHIWIPGTSPVRYFCGACEARVAAGVSSWQLLEPREIVCQGCVAAVSTVRDSTGFINGSRDIVDNFPHAY
jgi:hypothetical protein